MKQLAVFFLSISLAAGAFHCKASPYQLGPTCYYQYFSTVTNNFNCTTTFSTSGKNYLLSMEIMNIGQNDLVAVSWDNNTTSSTESSFSLQQSSLTNFTISIITGNSSMTGIFFICPTDVRSPVPVEQRQISYGQEAFILQQFPPPPMGALVNLNVPRKWEVTTDTQVAVIAAADTTTQQMNCPVDSCMQLIWIYEGSGENARFIGTAADFQNKLYLSQNTTMTLYFVTMDMGTDYMAVIANEAKNLEKCSSFNAVWYYTLNNVYRPTLNVTKPGGGACLTVLNHCMNQALCDGVVLYDTINFGSSDFYVYAGAPHPDPIKARLGIENFSQQTTSYLFPQSFAGNARTFYIANDSAILTFGDPTRSLSIPYLNRRGFIMTNFYPMFSFNMYGGTLDLDRVAYSYNITLKLNTTYAPVGSDAYLEFDKDGNPVQKMGFDINTNVGTQFTVHVEANCYCRIFLWGGVFPNQGSYATYFIEAGEVTTTTTTTSKPTTPSTSPPTTVTTVSTIVTKSTTTTPLPTTPKTTRRPTDPTTTPKTTPRVYFMLVTMFSALLCFV